VEIVLVMCGLSLWAYRKGLLFISGLLLALCTIKYTLIAVVPLAIIVRREWKLLWGFMVGCSILTAISFVLQGFDWPARYARILLANRRTGVMELMPTIGGLIGGSVPAQLLISIVVVLAVLLIARRMGTEGGISAALTAGILVSPHAYMYDVLLAYPLALAVVNGIPNVPRIAGFAVLFPIQVFFDSRHTFPPKVIAIAMLVCLAEVALATRSEIRDTNQATKQ
jgi:hypothetical protein